MIDANELQELINNCKKEYPDVDPYIIWVYSVDYLLNKNGIYGDEKLAQELYEKSKHPEYGIRIQD